MQLEIPDTYSPKENIIFRPDNEWFLTRLGDIGVELTYTNTKWYFNWYKYEAVITCITDWWCFNKDCDLDDLVLDKLASDGRCAGCPRIFVEEILEDTHSSKSHGKILHPQNLEEVRQNILAEYKKLCHNGFHHKNLYRIMHGTWVLE